MAVPRLYTTALSVKRGQVLQVCASYDDGSQLAQSAWLRLFRVQHLDDVTQPVAANLILSRRVQLPGTGAGVWNREEGGYHWPVCFEHTIPDDPVRWPVGLYAVQVSQQASFAQASTAYWLVRPAAPTPGASLLLCWPWSTTAAYVGLDADADGGAFTSLYDSDKSRRGRRIALQRPFDRFAEGEKRGYTHHLPLLLWTWLLTEGYDVDPCTSFDLDAEPALLDHYQLLLSVGHDEYWSAAMRDHVEAFVARGGNVAFFSANTAWWAVRMEEGGSVMACYKSSLEDPMATPAPALTTSNWASSPVDRPENRLTGVSFRRGSMGASATPFTVVADPAHEPFLHGLAPRSRIPASGTLFDLETDAAAYRIEHGRHVVTGVDGTPLNFRILAVAEFTTRSFARQAATMGYFTNGGTVFTAATTDWAARLDDPVVATITRNVVERLAQPAVGPPWTLAPRAVPTTDWTVVRDGLRHAVALVALFQGDLLIHQDQGPILRGDADDPTGPWVPTRLPPEPGATSMGTRLYSAYLYVTSPAGVRYRDINAPDTAAWQTVTAALPGTCRAATAAARGPLFVIGDEQGEQTLYHDSPVWTRIGRLIPPLTALAGWNTKLFAIGTDGQLYGREATDIDLVWSVLGRAPAGTTLGLTAYFDRLLALVEREAGNPASRALLWRTATSTAGSLDPWLFFGRRSETAPPALAYALGPLPGSGGYWTAAAGTLPKVVATQVVPIGPGRVLLYDVPTRAGQAVQYSAAGQPQMLHTYPPNTFGAWSHVLAVPARTTAEPPRVLFYAAATGQGVVGQFDEQGRFGQDWASGDFRQQWTHVVSTWTGNVLFYDTNTGASVWGALTPEGRFVTHASIDGLAPGWEQLIAAGSCGLLFYRSGDGQGMFGELHQEFRERRREAFAPQSVIIPSANGAMLLYRPQTGEGFTGGFRDGHFMTLRHYPAGSFGAGWDVLGPIGTVS